MDVIARIQELANEHKMSEYRLRKLSGLSASTIANIYHRNTTPTIYTLEHICKAFEISLAEFFTTEEPVKLTEEQVNLLRHWDTLSVEQKQLILNLIMNMK